MKKIVIVVLLNLMLVGYSEAQISKIAVVFAQDKADETTIKHQQVVREYLEGLFKKYSIGISLDSTLQMSGEETIKIGNRSGVFWDGQLAKRVFENGSKALLVIYYSVIPFEKQATSNGKKLITYGCRSNTYLQIVNTENGQILTSQNYYGSAGTAIMGTDSYKTQTEAIKASLNDGLSDFQSIKTMIEK